MRKLALFCVVVLMLSVACMAVDDPNASVSSAASAVSKIEVFGGYGYLHMGSGLTSGTNTSMNTNGWEAAATYNVNRWLGATADFNGQYAGDFFGANSALAGTGVTASTHVYNFLFGPTATYRTRSKVTPFAHALFGDSHTTLVGSGLGASVSSSKNAFGMVLGGGVDVKANKKMSVRLAQLDYMHTSLNYNSWFGTTGLPTSQNHFRYSAGVVFKLF